ncbi:MAG: carboxypeptidase regulatory-like domain-containing protein, partial [Candidatus Hydrogenedentes bacterium]|nr:carboxypeptidase regulatory-like domain-containing protein [Candidatus Hydrogenedentota bacterium]
LLARLGRITLSGGALAGVGGKMAFVSIPKVVAAVVAIAVIAIAGITVRQVFTSQAALQPTVETSKEVPLTPPPGEATNPPAPVATAKPESDVMLAATATTPPSITQTVSGKVVDAATGDGIAGAEVHLSNSIGMLTATTDADGRYAIKDVSPSEYYVGCHKANGYYLGHEQDDPAKRAMKKLTISLGDPPAVVDFVLSKGLSFRGRVVDDAGRPAAGSRIIATAEIEKHRLRNTAATDVKGEFEVTGFPETVSFYVWAETEAHVSRTHGPFVLPQTAVEPEPVVLYSQSTVRGQVVDSSGRPLAGLNITPQFDPSDSGRTIEATSDARGVFELKGVFPGTHLMRVCKDVKIVNAGGPPFLELAPGQIVDDLELVCVVNDLSIRGKVTDARGSAIAHARVEVKRQALRAKTDGEGHYRLDGLSEGAYTLTASSEVHLPEDVEAVPAGAEDVNFVLQDAFLVRGSVTDESTGQPLAHFDIKSCTDPRWLFVEHYFVATTAPDGRFELPVPHRGKSIVVVRAPGYLLEQKEIVCEDVGPRTLTLDFSLTPHPAVHGSVRTTTGAPVSGALLFSGPIETYNADDFAAARTDEQGAFSLPPEKIGYDFFTVLHRNYPAAEAKLEPAHAQGAPLDIIVEDGSELVVLVTHGGVPVQDAWLNAGDVYTNHTFHTDPSGVCAMKSLPPGEQTIYIGMSMPSHPRGSMDQRVDVMLAPGKTTEISVNFPRGTAALGGALAGDPPLWLQLEVENGPRRVIFLDDPSAHQGHYLFSELPAGRAILVALGSGHRLNRSYELLLEEGRETIQEIDLDSGVEVTGELLPVQQGETGSVIIYRGSFPDGVDELADDERIHFLLGDADIGADGGFHVEHLAPGTYTFHARTYRQGQDQESEMVSEGIVVQEVTAEPTHVVLPVSR